MSTTMIPFTAETVLVPRQTFEKIADDLEAYHESMVVLQGEWDTIQTSMEKCDPDGYATLQQMSDRVTQERAECERDIERLQEALIAKTDDCCGARRRIKSDISTLKSEKARISAKLAAAEASLEGLDGRLIVSMEKRGWKHVKTTRNTILLKKNGGVAPLVISQPDLIPDHLCAFTFTLDPERWAEVRALFQIAGWRETLKAIEAKLTRVPSNSIIREALIQPCAMCDGPHDGNRSVEDLADCPSCGGSGRAAVPGAHLEERGTHIEIR